MPIQKIEKLNLLQRLRRIVLGKEKPDLLTRTSVLVGLVVWVYLFSWHLLTFLSIILMNNLKPQGNSQGPQIIKAAFQRVGSREYGYSDTLNRLLVHSIGEMILYGIVLIGLILIYRKKRLGFLLYIFAFLGTFVLTFFIMGTDYMSKELSMVDSLLILFGVLYFAIGLFLFYKKPKATVFQQQ